MKRLIVALVVCLATAPALAQGTIWKAEPGKGLGPLRLGMSAAQVYHYLAPTKYIGTRSNPRFVYFGKALLAEFEGGQAVMFTVSKRSAKAKGQPVRLVAPGGVQVGQPWAQVVKVYGSNYISRALKVAKKAPREYYYAYRSRGIGFHVKGSTVIQIDVWQARS